MSQLRHTDYHDALTRWVGRMLDGHRRQADPDAATVQQLQTLHEGMLTLRADIVAREQAIIAAESRLEDLAAGDRIDAFYAERMMKDAAHALERLSLYCLNHADRDDTRRVRRDSQTVLDGLEALAMGITRPAEPTQTPETGA